MGTSSADWQPRTGVAMGIPFNRQILANGEARVGWADKPNLRSFLKCDHGLFPYLPPPQFP
jgi:hypothetical protein